MILITRPPREARILKNLLTEKGYDSHIFSLSSSIQSQSSIKPKKKYVTLLTSIRATEIFIKSKLIPKHQPIIVVGGKSFKKLHATGFKNILHCAKDSKAMISFIEKKFVDICKKKNYKGIEYCSGHQINQNFLNKLYQYNLNVKRKVLYKMIFKKSLNTITKKLIEKNLITYCFLYSQQNANKFLELIKKENLERHCKSILFLTLSKDIASIIKTSGFDNVKHANQPNQVSLLKMLEKVTL